MAEHRARVIAVYAPEAGPEHLAAVGKRQPPAWPNRTMRALHLPTGMPSQARAHLPPHPTARRSTLRAPPRSACTTAGAAAGAAQDWRSSRCRRAACCGRCGQAARCGSKPACLVMMARLSTVLLQTLQRPCAPGRARRRRPFWINRSGTRSNFSNLFRCFGLLDRFRRRRLREPPGARCFGRPWLLPTTAASGFRSAAGRLGP